jgi:multiple sugar transport system substrate-binding protein
MQSTSRRHRLAVRLAAFAIAVVAAATTLTACGSGGTTASNNAASANAPAASSGGSGVFMSDQLSELTEAQGFRNQVLGGFSSGLSFAPVEDDTNVINDLQAQAKSGKRAIDLVGALHGGFVSMQAEGLLSPVSNVADELEAAGIPKSLMTLGKLGTATQWYIPWIQGTYVMVANKQALPYLPAGANIDSLTYDQLLQWAQNIYKKTGQAKLGFPAGANGLVDRFLEGYLLPAYSGGMVTTFKSPAAVAAWQYLSQLWKYVNKSSVTYDFMSDPLQSGAVWLAWDHVARLQQVLTAQPNNFVVFPAPAGPHGRAFMPVVAGLGIPKGAPLAARADALIKYLLSPSAQDKAINSTGFFPVLPAAASATQSPGLKLEVDAVAEQQASRDALQSLLPVGLGTQSDAFNKVFLDSFTSIILHGQSPASVLPKEAASLQAVLDQAHAPCWKPDPVGSGTCQVG